MAFYRTCPVCGSHLDPGETCPDCKPEGNEPGVTVDEINDALPVATAKLQRIISTEGDDNGERLKESYLFELISEQIRSDRACAACKV